MCLIDAEQPGQEMGNMENNNINTNNNNRQSPLQCAILHNQTENLDKETPLMSSSFRKTMLNSFQVFDGHGGKDAAQFVHDNLPRVIVEDADFPLELEKVITRSFMETDAAFAKTCSLESSLASGTTALTAMIFGR